MDAVIISDVETGVMESITPVHVVSNHPGQEDKDTTRIKDAAPPVKTAASNTKMVKRLSF